LQYLGGLLSHEASKLCSDGPRYPGAEIDEKVKAFLSRPIEGDWRYLRIDAPYVKVRESGRIVLVAVIVAVGVNSDGRREVLGMDTGPSEAETFWTEFLHKLARRARAASSWSSPMPMKALRPLSLRCCMPPGGAAVHFMGNVLAHAGRQGRRVVAAFIGTLRPGRRRGCEDAMAPGPRSAASQSAEARRAHGRGRAPS